MKRIMTIIFGATLALSGCDSAPPKTEAAKPDAPLAELVDQTPAPVRSAGAEPAIETLAEFPHGAFLENLTLGADGAITFTSYFDMAIMRLARPGPVKELVRLDVYPIAIVPIDDGYVITAHGKSFAATPEFTKTNVILVLDRNGAVKSRTPVPQARFLNGADVDPSGQVLVADSLAGTIWRFDPAKGTVAEWLKAPELMPEPGAKKFALGANGLKIRGGAVYVSNTSRGTLYNVAIGPQGEPDSGADIVAQTGNIDDFDFADDESVYVATHQAEIKRVTPDGVVETFSTKGCDGCTSLAVWGEDNSKRLIVLSTGNWGTPGETTPARVLSVTIPTSN